MKYILFLAGVFLFFNNIDSSAQEKILSIKNDLDSVSDNYPWTNLNTIKHGNAYSGTSFSSTDKVNPYGLGYKGTLPDVCRNKNLHISFSEYIRTNNLSGEYLMVVSLSVGDSTIFWDSFNVSGRIDKANSWTQLTNEVNIPASFTQPKYLFAVYLWNKDGKSIVDVDDMEIEFSEMQLPSFLPQDYIEKKIDSGWLKMAAAKEFALFYNKEEGNVMVLSAKGDTLIRSIACVSEWMESKNMKKQSWSYRLFYRTDSLTEDGPVYRFSINNEISENELLILAGNDGQLKFNFNSVFLQPVELYRQALAISYALPLKEVFKKSTLSDTSDFKNEYWLGKQGFKLANKKESFVIYHLQQISSLQLDTKRKVAFINSDYAADHPFLHYPLMKENKNQFEDRSTSLYKKNDKLTAEFGFSLSVPGVKVARMINNPRGFLSSFIWTEHADYGDLRLHKAVYYGSEKISRVDDATGGFIRYSIPVTKSYFYSNPDNIDNSEKAGFLPGPIATYKENPEFANFLLGLYESGNEICLHTPEHFSSNRKLLEEALEAGRRRFNSVSWIDHGYDNSEKSNRENLMCDGTDSTSIWYAADLWKKYGIKYLWDPYYEETNVLKGFGFNSFYSYPYSDWSDAFPEESFWRLPSRTGNFIHWPTMSTWDPADSTSWNYFFNDMRLGDLVSNRCDVILHCYPARVDSSQGFYSIVNGVAVANSSFNDALKKLSFYRSKKKIWLTTISEMLDYRISLENLSCRIFSNGTISVRNNGTGRIGGLTFSAIAKTVTVSGKKAETKVENGELVFWFDLEPSEEVVIDLK